MGLRNSCPLFSLSPRPLLGKNRVLETSGGDHRICDFLSHRGSGKLSFPHAFLAQDSSHRVLQGSNVKCHSYVQTALSLNTNLATYLSFLGFLLL